MTGKKLTAYKGFDKDFKCKGFQFEEGKTYEHEGNVEICESGFHSCEYPLDVFSYYPPSSSRFAVVEASGKLSHSSEDSKIASKNIKVVKEIGLSDIIIHAVDYIKSSLDKHTEDAVATDDCSVAMNTGYQSAATNTGNRSAATNTGYQSVATNTGCQSAATNTGNGSVATNTGYRSAATNTGSYSVATNTGNYSAATNTGHYSAATNTGYYSAATNTGHQSVAEVNGSWSVAMATGTQSKAKAATGSAIVLCYRDNKGQLIHIRASKVGENGIKPDTWYSLDENGQFVEGKENEGTCGTSDLTVGLGTPLVTVTDVERLQADVEFLWQLLDDIDTATDMAKDNDKWYRAQVERLQGKRHQRVTSDGYTLFAVPNVMYTTP